MHILSLPLLYTLLLTTAFCVSSHLTRIPTLLAPNGVPHQKRIPMDPQPRVNPPQQQPPSSSPSPNPMSPSLAENIRRGFNQGAEILSALSYEATYVYRIKIVFDPPVMGLRFDHSTTARSGPWPSIVISLAGFSASQNARFILIMKAVEGAWGDWEMLNSGPGPAGITLGTFSLDNVRMGLEAAGDRALSKVRIYWKWSEVTLHLRSIGEGEGGTRRRYYGPEMVYDFEWEGPDGMVTVVVDDGEVLDTREERGSDPVLPGAGEAKKKGWW